MEHAPERKISQDVEILPDGWQQQVYHTWSMPWLLMPWLLASPCHQQLWHRSICPGIFRSQLQKGYVFIPPLQRSWKGAYWFHLVRLSVCGQNRVRSASSTILAGSFSYLYILWSNFRRCVACKVFFLQNSKILNFGKFFKFVTLTLFSFDLGSNMGNQEAAGGIFRTQDFYHYDDVIKWKQFPRYWPIGNPPVTGGFS